MRKKFFRFFIRLFILILAVYLLQGVAKRGPQSSTIQYELVKNWPDLPKDLLLGNPSGIGIDTSGNVIVFHRSDREWPLMGSMPTQPIKNKTILVIDHQTGKLINSWGDHLFVMPHGLTVDDHNNIWVTDVALNQVFKFSYDGKLLMTLGEAGVAGNDKLHFDKPTDIAIAKDGSFYVSDGYGNSRVIRFSPSGKYLFQWGNKGNDNSEFDIPHALSLDRYQHVYVADRENNRIQEFDSSGKYITQYKSNFAHICSVDFDTTSSTLFAVDDLSFLGLKHRGSNVYVFDKAGSATASFGRSGSYDGNTAWYHDMAVDKEGNIYVGDILGNTIQKFRKIK